MQIIGIKAYQARELPDHAKLNAYAFIRESVTAWTWYTDIRDAFIKEAAKSGYTIKAEDMRFSGFDAPASDGVSFGALLNVHAWIKSTSRRTRRYKRLLKALPKSLCAVVERTPYTIVVHDKIMDVTLDAPDDLSEELLQLCDKLNFEMVVDAQKQAGNFYKKMQRTYKALTRTKYLDRVGDSMGYLFDETGRPVHHLNNHVS